jgi:hypothetical protein
VEQLPHSEQQPGGGAGDPETERRRHPLPQSMRPQPDAAAQQRGHDDA